MCFQFPELGLFSLAIMISLITGESLVSLVSLITLISLWSLYASISYPIINYMCSNIT